MRIYVDNAATTKMNAAVAEEMIPFMTEFLRKPHPVFIWRAGRQKGPLKSRENKLQRLFQRNLKKFTSQEAVLKQIIGLFAAPRQLILIKANIL